MVDRLYKVVADPQCLYKVAAGRQCLSQLRQSPVVAGRRLLDVVVQRVRDVDLGGDCYLYSLGMPCWPQNASDLVH